MKRQFKGLPMVLLVLLVGLAACGRNVGLSPTDLGNQEDGKPAAPSFAQFSDIPIPTGAAMDLDRTLIFGSRDAWIGRLVLSASHAPGDLFDFFKQRAPEFGWQEITSVRSATSVLTYTRGERVLTVQISGKRIRGADVDITISPRGGGAAIAPQGPPRSTPALPPVRSQPIR